MAFNASQTQLNLTAVGYSLGLAASVLYDLHVAARSTFWVAAAAGIIVFGSLMGAMFVGQQFLQAAITSAAKTSFLQGDQWAYAAGLIAVLVGAALVFFLPSAQGQGSPPRRQLRRRRPPATSARHSRIGPLSDRGGACRPWLRLAK